MKLVIQRVSRALVRVDGNITGQIGQGLVILLGIENGDGLEQVKQLSSKVMKLRLWPDLKDPNKAWVSSVVDNGYELLVVSQFTLFATFKKPKPDFHQAMTADAARPLYEAFVESCKAELKRPAAVAIGIFGAMMEVELCNDGPVTVELRAESQAAASESPSSPATARESPSTAEASSPSKPPKSPAPSRSPGGAVAVPFLAEYERQLQAQPYVAGFSPGLGDLELLKMLGDVRWSDLSPNVLRWVSHISSFSSTERSTWSQ